MTKTSFCALWQQFKHMLLPFTLGSALFTFSALSADNTVDRAKRHDRRDTCKFHQFLAKGLTQVTPSTDFLLENSQTALADLYQPFLPDLSNILGQYNSFVPGNLFVNPKNPDNIFSFFVQDRFREIAKPRTYLRMTNAGTQLAISEDGGKSWSYSSPLLPTWLGGTLGQTTSGSSLAFLGKKTLLFAGSSDQSRPIPPTPRAMSFTAVTKSRDGGFTWSDPIVLSTGDSSNFNLPGFGGPAVGISVRSDSILFNKGAAIVSITNVDSGRDTLYGNISYSRSKDRGNTWSPAATLYDAASDPTFVAQHGYENLTVDPPITLGGQSGFSTLVAVPGGRNHDKNNSGGHSDVLLAGFVRFYPQRGTLVYQQFPADSFFDHAVVRSFDNGRTWTREAVEVGQYILGSSHDPRIPGVFDLIVADGALVSAIAVSPKTGRVYYAWQGGNPAFDPDPSINQFFPIIQLSSSADQGASWSPMVQVNQTPLNRTVTGASQAFNPNIAVTECGYVGITYEDFRNYTGGDVIQTDAWLAIYKETSNPRGGSTGVGLDFVKEVRLTPQSFDAAIGFDSKPLNGIGGTTGIGVRDNEFVTTFSVTNQGNLPTVTGPFGSTQDLNNRINVFFEKIKLRK